MNLSVLIVLYLLSINEIKLKYYLHLVKIAHFIKRYGLNWVMIHRFSKVMWLLSMRLWCTIVLNTYSKKCKV